MAKNKVKGKKDQDEYIDQDEVIYEEEVNDGDDLQDDDRPFLEKYRNYLIVGGIAIGALVVFMIFRSRNLEESNTEAQVALINAVVHFERDSLGWAIAGDGQSVGFETLINDYDGTKTANLARFYLGAAYLKQGQIDQGIKYLEDFDRGDNMVAAAAYAGLGYAYEQKGEFEEAAKNYKNASKTPDENDFSTPFYLMHAARNYESANNMEEALKIYRTIRDKYPTSLQANDGNIEKYIARLSPSEDE